MTQLVTSIGVVFPEGVVCSTCGLPLDYGPEAWRDQEYRAVIRDNMGLHHDWCWGNVAGESLSTRIACVAEQAWAEGL